MFLKIVLIISIFYLVFRMLSRFILPFLVKWYVKRFQQKFYNQNPGYEEKRKEGDVSVRSSENKTKDEKDSSGLGEYVDYEDVE